VADVVSKLKKVHFQKKDQQDKRDVQKINTENRKDGKMLNGVDSLSYSGRTRQQAKADVGEGQKSVEEYIGEKFDQEWRFVSIVVKNYKLY